MLIALLWYNMYRNHCDSPNNCIKIRQSFLKKFENFSFWYSYFFWKDLSREYLVVLKFLLEVLKFKENLNLRNHCYKNAWSLTHTFTSNNNACGMISKMNEHGLLILINTSLGARLRFSEGRFPNFRKGENKYKTKKKQIQVIYGWYNFLIIRSYKIRYAYGCRQKKFFQREKTKIIFENLIFPQRDFWLLVKLTLKYAW